jgi:N-acetylglucosaminyldiphosphoundecaprenol N-acetyl-beta-D-mannosaminyltransferase
MVERAAAPSGKEQVQVLNAGFDSCTLESCVDKVVAAAAEGERAWLATVNVAILMAMRGDPELQDYVDHARWVVADGQPLVWLSRFLGRPLPQRVTGVDLIERLCQRAEEDGLGVFFLGASDEVITAAEQAMKSRYPRLRLQVANGYFKDEEALERVSAIAGTGTSFVFVGMGVPRQERFIREYLDDLKVNVAIGVGGSFDVIGGLRGRAPRALQRSGLEWTYRLIQEPRRLWRRYLVTGMQFGVLAILALVQERRGHSRRQP